MIQKKKKKRKRRPRKGVADHAHVPTASTTWDIEVGKVSLNEEFLGFDSLATPALLKDRLILTSRPKAEIPTHPMQYTCASTLLGLGDSPSKPSQLDPYLEFKQMQATVAELVLQRFNTHPGTHLYCIYTSTVTTPTLPPPTTNMITVSTRARMHAG